MEGRLDARLTDLPPASFHGLAGRISAVDECKGWWKGGGHSHRSVLARMKKQTISVSSDAGERIAAMTTFPSPRKHPWERGRSGTGQAERARRAGYAELLRSVFEDHRDMEFGQDLILRFHHRLFRYSAADRDHRGRYKTLPDKQSTVPGGWMESLSLRPTEPHLVPGEMEILTRWAAARLATPDFHPLFVTAAFLLEFLAIRPFADGNGRMSRILANFLLLKSGYEYVPYVSLDGIIADRGADYLIALRKAQAKRNFPRPDITSWLAIFLEVARAQAWELRAVLERSPGEDLLSGNQRAVLSLLDRHGEVSIRLVRRELGLPRDTAKQVLRRLYDMNLVLRSGAGRATRYLRLSPSPG